MCDQAAFVPGSNVFQYTVYKKSLFSALNSNIMLGGQIGADDIPYPGLDRLEVAQPAA